MLVIAIFFGGFGIANEVVATARSVETMAIFILALFVTMNWIKNGCAVMRWTGRGYKAQSKQGRSKTYIRSFHASQNSKDWIKLHQGVLPIAKRNDPSRV